MFVRDMGAGPVVLLLHGMPSPAVDWLPVVDRLAASYRVLVPDLPGYGDSPPLLAPHRTEHYANALAVMLAERGVTRLRAVAGLSGGAYLALDLVLRRLVEADLVISLAGLATLDDAARAWRRDVARAVAAEPGYLERELDPIVPGLLLAADWRATHPDDDARVTGWLHLTPPQVFAAEFAALAEMRDLRPELPELRSSLYLRVGALDVACPPAGSEEMSSLVPGATLDIIPGCGHALLIEDADATTAAIVAQLELAAPAA